MVFTKEETEKIVKKIEDAIKKKRGQGGFQCPVCTNNNFSLAGGFTNDFLMDKMSGNLRIGGPTLPSVPIVCTNCGNTFFLNAKILGIEENKPSQEKTTNKQSKKENGK
jgi:transcription initiation factor IIE alpha subunit